MSTNKGPRNTNESALAKRRKELGITQQQLSEMVGVRQEQISRWEKGLFVMRADTMLKLAEALQCNPQDLF